MATGTFLTRRDLDANWASANPVLQDGELGIEKRTTGSPARMKVGDGTTAWAALPYLTSTPKKVIYASQVGAALNTNLMTGGGTDDTAVLQAVLDSAPSLGGVHLIVDGPALVTGLKVSSNTRLEFLPGAGLFLKAGSNAPMLMGKNPQYYNAAGVTPVDQNIDIIGGFLNGNGENQADTDANNNYTIGTAWYGVKWLTFYKVHVYNTRAWGTSIWYASYCRFIDHQHSLVPGSTRISQDGINVRGPSDHVLIRGGWFNTYDDAIALNGRDYGSARSYGGQYCGDGGSITDVVIENVTLVDALFGVDILTDSFLIDRVHINGIHGTCRNYFLSLSNYPYSPYAAPTTKGTFGSISVDNVDATTIGAPFLGGNDGTYNEFENIRIQADVNQLSLSNFKTKLGVDYRPQIRIMPGGYTVKHLTIDGFNIYDSIGGSVNYPRMQFEGTVDRLYINGARWYRGNALTAAGDFLKLISGGISSSLTITGMAANRISNLINQAGGTLPTVRLTGVHVDDSAAGNVLSVTSAAPSIYFSGTSTNGTLVGGANEANVTVRKGDAFL